MILQSYFKAIYDRRLLIRMVTVELNGRTLLQLHWCLWMLLKCKNTISFQVKRIVRARFNLGEKRSYQTLNLGILNLAEKKFSRRWPHDQFLKLLQILIFSLKKTFGRRIKLFETKFLNFFRYEMIKVVKVDETFYLLLSQNWKRQFQNWNCSEGEKFSKFNFLETSPNENCTFSLVDVLSKNEIFLRLRFFEERNQCDQIGQFIGL